MIKVGITGQAGFIGSHLYNYLNLKKDEIITIPFKDNYFEREELLDEFVKGCDSIVHLAALNRHNDPQTIYDTNIGLVKKLISALGNTGSRPHILFSSSTQEKRNNVFGRSKREGREMLAQWAERNGVKFTGMVIPNVFGPFGNPYYNSVVATFSHQLTHNEEPEIEVDAQLKLIYISDLVNIIYNTISKRLSEKEFKVPHTNEIKVTEILSLLQSFKSLWFNKGILPDLQNPFERNLFNNQTRYNQGKSFSHTQG